MFKFLSQSVPLSFLPSLIFHSAKNTGSSVIRKQIYCATELRSPSGDIQCCPISSIQRKTDELAKLLDLTSGFSTEFCP